MQSANDLVDRWVRPQIQGLSPYHVPDPDGLIKLDAMENPYAWPDELRREWAQALQRVDVNRYPDPSARALKGRLRRGLGLPEDAELLLGNGSDEIIQMLALTLGGEGRVVLSVDPGFVMYRMIASFAGLEYVGVPLGAEDFSLDLAAVLKALERHRPALVFLAYPNNPTGNLFDAAAVGEIIAAAPGLVVVDEAYAPFTDSSFLPRVLEHDNLLVMRTLSKMGLAGLRLGMIVGAEAWIRELDKTRLPYNINVLTQVSAELALRHQELFDEQTRTIRRERGRLLARLDELNAFRVFPSEANFILFRAAAGKGPRLFQGLLDRGVLIKNLHGSHPLLTDCLRVTVGTPDENDVFLAALQSVLRT
jgi:histidinol-phosphate aminotransferase